MVLSEWKIKNDIYYIGDNNYAKQGEKRPLCAIFGETGSCLNFTLLDSFILKG